MMRQLTYRAAAWASPFSRSTGGFPIAQQPRSYGSIPEQHEVASKTTEIDKFKQKLSDLKNSSPQFASLLNTLKIDLDDSERNRVINVIVDFLKQPNHTAAQVEQLAHSMLTGSSFYGVVRLGFEKIPTVSAVLNPLANVVIAIFVFMEGIRAESLTNDASMVLFDNDLSSQINHNLDTQIDLSCASVVLACLSLFSTVGLGSKLNVLLHTLMTAGGVVLFAAFDPIAEAVRDTSYKVIDWANNCLNSDPNPYAKKVCEKLLSSSDKLVETTQLQNNAFNYLLPVAASTMLIRFIKSLIVYVDFKRARSDIRRILVNLNRDRILSDADIGVASETLDIFSYKAVCQVGNLLVVFQAAKSSSSQESEMDRLL